MRSTILALLSATALLATRVTAQGVAKTLTVTWDPATVAAKCQAATSASNYSYFGKFDVLYFAGLSGAESGTAAPSVDISKGNTSFDFTFSPNTQRLNVSGCCISPSYLGNKFRCIANGTFDVNPMAFLPSGVAIASNASATTPTSVASIATGTASPTPAITPTAKSLTVSWDPTSVAAKCQAATAAYNYTYPATFDVIYMAGISGAAQGTAASNVNISAGTVSFPFTFFAGVQQLNVSGCCISPSATTGIKFRCIGNGTFDLNQAGFTPEGNAIYIQNSGSMQTAPVVEPTVTASTSSTTARTATPSSTSMSASSTAVASAGTGSANAAAVSPTPTAAARSGASTLSVGFGALVGVAVMFLAL